MRSLTDVLVAFRSYTSTVDKTLIRGQLRDLDMYVVAVKNSRREEEEVDMFAIISTYRAKFGEEDAILALHENWKRNRGSNVYLSWQLFRNIQVPRDFIAVAQFENEEAAWAAINDLKRDAWYDRLISLTEEGTAYTDYMRVWQLQ